MDFIEDSQGVIRVRAWQDLPWLVHGWTTRAAGDFRRLPGEEELNRKLAVSGMEPRLVRQVHSNRIHVANSRQLHSEGPAEADGLVSAQPGLLLGMRTADCLAVLLVDRHRRAVAAIHAGWRGTVQRIAVGAVKKMHEEFGSAPKEIEAAIGPGIGKCCFEVGDDVAEQFDPSVTSDHQRPRIDLDAANRKHLSEVGISEEHIWSSDMCTHCSPEQFFSYRRDGDAAGRMLAAIGVNRT